MKYYKVVNELASEITIDTSYVNYDLTLPNTNKYNLFLNLITDYSFGYDLPIDFFYFLNNNLALWGDVFLQNLPKFIDRQFELFSLTQNVYHKGFYISVDVLNAILRSLYSIGIELFNEGLYLWEHIFESVRVNEFQSQVSRRKSFFLFDKVEDCQYYIEKHKGGGVIVCVDIVSGAVPFKADMNLLDSIPDHLTFKEAEKTAKNYWSGSRSANPIYEYLFQGVCKMYPM